VCNGVAKAAFILVCADDGGAVSFCRADFACRLFAAIAARILTV